MLRYVIQVHIYFFKVKIIFIYSFMFMLFTFRANSEQHDSLHLAKRLFFAVIGMAASVAMGVGVDARMVVLLTSVVAPCMLTAVSVALLGSCT